MSLVTPDLSQEIDALLHEAQEDMVGLLKEGSREAEGIVENGMRAVGNMDKPYMDLMVKKELTVWRRYYG